MNALSNVASIVINRAHQAEAKIQENIRQSTREIQSITRVNTTQAYKVDISQAARQKATGHF